MMRHLIHGQSIVKILYPLFNDTIGVKGTLFVGKVTFLHIGVDWPTSLIETWIKLWWLIEFVRTVHDLFYRLLSTVFIHYVG